MPKKFQKSEYVPSLIQEKLNLWGRSIHAQRIRQHISAENLCQRIDISDATLRRMERGGAGVSIAAYMSAFMVLGILDNIVPMPDPLYWDVSTKTRVRTKADDDYF